MNLNCREYNILCRIIKSGLFSLVEKGKKLELINILERPAKKMCAIEGAKDAMILYDIFSMYYTESSVNIKNRYDSCILKLDNRFMTGPNYLSIGITALDDNSLISLNRNFGSSLIFSFVKNRQMKQVEFNLSLTEQISCWIFLESVKGQSRCSLSVPYENLIKSYSTAQIFYILFLLQYSAVRWTEKIFRELKKGENLEYNII